MGTVRGNIGTALEHVVLGVIVDFVSERGEGPLRYVDTHSMAPLNRPVGRDFNLLEQLRGSGRATTVPGASIYTEVFAPAWLPGTVDWYPTHFVHAGRVANRKGCPVTAWLFEVNARDALPHGHAAEDRRGEIAAFLANQTTQLAVGLTDFTGMLAPAPGDFRQPGSWPTPREWPGGALVLMSDPLEYRPEFDPGGSRLGAADFERIGERLTVSFPIQPHLRAHVVFVSANLGTWGGDAVAATTHISDAWRQYLALPGGTWCGACLWSGFLVFVGITAASASSALDDCAALPQRFKRALCDLHRSRSGNQPEWIEG